MGWLIGAALFLLPFLVYAAWQKRAGATPASALAPSAAVLVVACIGVALAVSGFVWYGFDRGMDRDTVYVPARLAPDGSLIPGHGESARR